MKKIFYFAAMASVALSSCVNEAEEMIGGDASVKEISFNAPVVGHSTRGPLVDDAAFPADANHKFDVWAVWSKGNLTTWESATTYMNKVPVTYKDGYDSGFNQSTLDNVQNNKTGGWHSETPYYWPKDGYLSFAAVYPSGLTGATYTKTGLIVQDFTVTSPTSGDQVDLMFSERTLNKNTSKNVGNKDYDGVDINFHHALSQIMFTAKTDVATSTVITLKNIELTGVINKGSFAEDIADGDKYNCPATSTDLWDESAENDDKQAYTGYENTSGIVLNGNAATLTATNNTSPNQGLMLIPQTIPADAKIKVTYTITPFDGATPIDQVLEVSLSQTGLTAWNWGTRYTYNLTISLDEIYFAPSVTAWESASSQSSNVTI